MSAGVIVLDSVADSEGVVDEDRLAVSAGVIVLVVVPEGVARVEDCEGLSFEAVSDLVPPVADAVGTVRLSVAPVEEAVGVSAGVIVRVSVPEPVGLVPEGEVVAEPSLFVAVADPVGCVCDTEVVGVSADVIVLDSVADREGVEDADRLAVSAGVMVLVVVPEGVARVEDCEGLSFDAVSELVPPVADAVGTVRLSVAPVAEAVGVSAGVMVRVSVPDPVGFVPESDLVSEPSLFVSVADPVG